MAKIFDASRACEFSHRKIVFDTNVWISIDSCDPRTERRAYSDFYKEAIAKGNTIVINDYILGEFFNASCRIQYDLVYDDDPKRIKFKKRRQSPEFKDFMDTVRDTCLNILDDCEFEGAFSPDCTLSGYLKEAGSGTVDFSDIVIREHCRSKGYVIVSHDADFADCGIDLVTANPRILNRISNSSKIKK